MSALSPTIFNVARTTKRVDCRSLYAGCAGRSRILNPPKSKPTFEDSDLNRSRRRFLFETAAAFAYAAARPALALTNKADLEITTPMDAPEWALLERQVLQAHTAACET